MVVSNGAQGFKQKIEQATEAVLRIARTQHPTEAAAAAKVAVERRKSASAKGAFTKVTAAVALQGGGGKAVTFADEEAK